MPMPQPPYELTLRTIAMPADSNPAGHIFGGWVMSQMDLAAYLCSSELAGGRTVTAAVREMSFARPVHIGDTVCLYTCVTRKGRSSVDVSVQVWTRRAHNPERIKVTEGSFTMVAVDGDGTPRPAFSEG